MSLSVNKQTSVAPAGAPPSQRRPAASSSPPWTALLQSESTILVFQQGLASAKAITSRRAHLRAAPRRFRALVPYYPVAGRIFEPLPGEPEVACTGEGVWFVEVSVDCNLKDVNNLERPLLLPKEELIPFAPAEVEEEDLIMMMQVTEFTCGGFAVGTRLTHVVFDGLGAAQFSKAVAEIARGHARPVVHPVWCRDAIPSPPKLSPGLPLPSFEAFNFENSVFDIPSDHIDAVKNQFWRETGQKCSAFDVVTATAWQCRTRAIFFDAHVDVHLGFNANTRHLLRGLLPQEGYYGNCVYPMGIKAKAGTIAGSSPVEVIELIRDAKERISTKFLDWMMGETAEEDPYRVPPGYGTLVVSDWRRLGFSEVNYGWGEPIHVTPLNDDSNFVASCIYLSPPKPKQGLRLMTRCCEKDHLPAFHEEMMKFI